MAKMSACQNPEHRGHRVFVGGPFDGHIDHLVYATSRDYPFAWTYPNGAHYVRDLDGGTDQTYRFEDWR